MKDAEVIVEFVQCGAYVKVSAMHTPSMTEAVIVGPPSAGEIVLRRNALRKLEYLLRKSQVNRPPTRGVLV